MSEPSLLDPTHVAAPGVWRLGGLLLAGACLLHGARLSDTWAAASPDGRGTDFAVYHRAVQVVAAGGDPYRDGGSPPYLYPPPFLLAMQWTRLAELGTAYHVWFWLNELFAVVGLVSLWRGWRTWGPEVGVLVALAAALCSGLLHNHALGQASLAVWALAIAGVTLAERGRPSIGGILVGIAAALKVGPLIFVAGWLLRRQRAAAAALVTLAVAFAAAALALGGGVVTSFVTQVVPGLASGEYGGLTVEIDAFGNQSLASLYQGLLAPGQAFRMSASVAVLTYISALMLIAAVALAVRRGAPAAVQISLFGLVLVLAPVYSFEHYAVWALPAVVLTAREALRGRWRGLGRWVLAAAWIVWALDVRVLKGLATQTPAVAPLLAWAKLAATLVLFAACLLLVRRRSEAA